MDDSSGASSFPSCLFYFFFNFFYFSFGFAFLCLAYVIVPLASDLLLHWVHPLLSHMRFSTIYSFLFLFMQYSKLWQCKLMFLIVLHRSSCVCEVDCLFIYLFHFNLPIAFYCYSIGIKKGWDHFRSIFILWTPRRSTFYFVA